jgi:hypothetical protein
MFYLDLLFAFAYFASAYVDNAVIKIAISNLNIPLPPS